MKNLEYIIFTVITIFLISCNKDEPREYPGNIIIHGPTYLKVLGTQSNESAARIYAFSGSHADDLSSLDGENFTYEIWIRVDEDCLIGDKNAANGNLANGACISERSNIFELYLVDDDDADFAIKYGRLNGVNNQTATMYSGNSSVNLHFNEWIHVAISRSSVDNIAKFYINGILIDSSNDPVWIQQVNDTWLDFNYMYRSGNKNFFKGQMDNIRVSKIDRYPNEFEPDITLKYNEYRDDLGQVVSNPIDAETLLQLDLENHVTPFDSSSGNYPNYTKIEIKGSYDYYIKIHKDFFEWESEILNEYEVPRGF